MIFYTTKQFLCIFFILFFLSRLFFSQFSYKNISQQLYIKIVCLRRNCLSFYVKTFHTKYGEMCATCPMLNVTPDFIHIHSVRFYRRYSKEKINSLLLPLCATHFVFLCFLFVVIRFVRFPATPKQIFYACLLHPNMNMTDNKILTERCHRI